MVLLGGSVTALATAGAAPRAEGEALPAARQVVETRLVVVGGGIVGASLAYSAGRVLARSGSGRSARQGIVLLDRGLVGTEASGLSAGTIENGASRRRDADLKTLLRFKATRMLERLAARGYEFGLTRNEQETARARTCSCSCS